jgi:hypothetical protein
VLLFYHHKEWRVLSWAIQHALIIKDRLCGLVVRVPGYRYRDPGFDSRSYQIFWEAVGLERVHSASWW